MIQRPQSIYMLLSILLLASTLTLPALVGVTPAGSAFELSTYWVTGGTDAGTGATAGLLAVPLSLLLMSVGFVVLALVMYRARMRQVRYLYISSALAVGVLAALINHYHERSPDMSELFAGARWGAAALVIACVLNTIAASMVMRDHIKVRSMGRLR